MGKALWGHLKGERLVHRTQRALWRRCSSPRLAETLPCRGIICNSLKKSIQFNLISALGVTSTAIINVQQSTLRLMAVRLLPSHTAYLTTHFKLHPKSQQEHSMSTKIQAKLQQMELDEWWIGGIKKEVRGKNNFYLLPVQINICGCTEQDKESWEEDSLNIKMPPITFGHNINTHKKCVLTAVSTYIHLYKTLHRQEAWAMKSRSMFYTTYVPHLGMRRSSLPKLSWNIFRFSERNVDIIKYIIQHTTNTACNLTSFKSPICGYSLGWNLSCKHLSLLALYKLWQPSKEQFFFLKFTPREPNCIIIYCGTKCCH